MIVISDIGAAIVQRWRQSRRLAQLIPGGLWLAGAIPADALAPYASYTITETDSERGSNYVIRRYEIAISVWSDAAAADAGNIARVVEEWLEIEPTKLQLVNAKVLRVRPGTAELEVAPTPRAANDITITRQNRRVSIAESI